jgi:hypothetical protein
MNVTIWGKSGWPLFHSIAEGYPDHPTAADRQAYILFFSSIKYVLPCIYCRASFAEYSGKLPITDHLQNKESMRLWMYEIHNMVNAKLRGQGLNKNPDPSFDEVKQKYIKYVRDINENGCKNMPGWTFIYCALFNYPQTIDEQEDFTIDRQAGYITFLQSLVDVIPFNLAQKALLKFKDQFDVSCLKSRQSLQLLAYHMEFAVTELTDCHCQSYDKICKEIDGYRVGCKEIDGVGTCRLNFGKK